MTTVANIAVALVALLHVYFLVLEMFLWDKPRGLRTFGLTPEFAAASKALAANQGLYNGFLAAGLVWGLALGVTGDSIKIFFLACITLAGIFGAVTANRRSFGYRQFPGAIALAWCYFREGAKPTSIHRGCRRIRRCRVAAASRGGARCEDKLILLGTGGGPRPRKASSAPARVTSRTMWRT